MALVGAADCREARAGFPLGVLAIRGLLADPGVDARVAQEQTEARLTAGIWFAADHAMTWGIVTPRSHFGDFMLREGYGDAKTDEQLAVAALRYDKKIAVLLGMPRSKPTALTIVARVVIEEEFAISASELPVLRQSLEALAGLSR